MENLVMDILEYKPEHQPWFEKFNRDWIEKFFWMEPIDVDVLQHPNIHIINKGGTILMACCGKEIAGTVALKFVESGVYEFTKMAVDEKFRGLGLGKALAEAAIEKAKALGARAIILYSNRMLKVAISLYKKLGFLEVPIDGTYARSDIKMKLVLDEVQHPVRYSIRNATIKDASLLRELGTKTFAETFAAYNTAENMKLFLEENYRIEALKKEIEEPGSVFLIAFDGDHEIGFAKMIKNNINPEGILSLNAIELERIYTTKEYIGKGVGSALMQACFDLSRLQKCDTMWLGVWEHNTRALAFYEKYGFEIFGSHPFILGNDIQTDLLMKKQLT